MDKHLRASKIMFFRALWATIAVTPRGNWIGSKRHKLPPK